MSNCDAAPAANPYVAAPDILELARGCECEESGSTAEADPQPAIPPWLTHVRSNTPRRSYRCLPLPTRIAKRILDVIGAALLLILTSPVILTAALAIRLTTPGPAFFLQTRVGLNKRRPERLNSGTQPPLELRRQVPNFGRPFTIIKLRTMYWSEAQAGPSQAVSADSRVTPLGRFLRRSRIDELPQLLNVLHGDMSLVGPRPECIEYMEDLARRVPGYPERLGLKPGLTGIAQIENGYANSLRSYQRKAAYDLLYLQHCCLINDLKILLRTVRVVLTGFGAL